MKTIAAAVIASLFAVAPAVAAPKAAPTVEPSPAATSEAAAPVRNANTRYCYNTEMTGSHIISRVCKTRADWKELGVNVPANL